MSMTASPILHGGSALICLAWTLLILGVGRGRTSRLLAATTAMVALWAVATAFARQDLANVFEIMRWAVWLGVLLALCRLQAGVWSAALAWRLGLLGSLLTVLSLVWLLPDVAAATTSAGLGSIGWIARMALALLVVLMAENLYRNATEAARWHVALPCIALGCLSVFDLVLYADAAIYRGFSQSLMDARPVLSALAAPLVAIAAVRNRRSRRDLPVSREFVFHGATLMVAGTFLLGVGAASEALRQMSEPFAQVARMAMLGAALMALLIAISARSVRSRLRRAMEDYFFRARYDYRAEWLRCVATLSMPEVEAAADIRAIRALADAVDSPAGILILREHADVAMRWASGWNAAAGDISPAGHAELVAALRDGNWIVRSGPAELPELRSLFPALWLVIPLMHHRDGLMGTVLLARPRASFALSREVFDLLRMLGREVAMFLAERRGAERLAEQAQLEAYATRFAFVAHDVKTVASQLTMLLGNAANHISDPAFQQDMLLTVRASADRINTLIARLRSPAEAAGGKTPAGTEPLERLRVLAGRIAHPVEIDHDGSPICHIAMAPDQFDAAVTHLLDNAAEACPRGDPVRLRLLREGSCTVLEIIDRGPGMSDAFVRNMLFRPLVSSKPNGSGIGAWQARELLRRAGGQLDVVTGPGRGTTMRLFLPAFAGESLHVEPQQGRGVAAE